MVYIKLLLYAYIFGVIIVLGFHIVLLQMVTPELAVLRAIFWPIYLATGWPHGTRLTID